MPGSGPGGRYDPIFPADQAALLAGLGVVQHLIGDDTVEIVDQNGIAGLEIDRLRVRHPAITLARRRALLAALKAAETQDWSSLRPAGTLLHMLGYGQSNSVSGAAAAPVLSMLGRSWARRFIGGVFPEDAGAGASAAAKYGTAFAPMGEKYRETVFSGAAEMFAQIMSDEEGIDLETLGGLKAIFSTAGEGGKTLAELSSPGTYFSRLTDHLSYGYDNAGLADLVYDLACVIWDQGEADHTLNTAQATYKSGVQALQTAVASAYQTKTGITKSIPWLSFQTSTWIASGATRPTVALAQLEMASDPTSLFALLAPTYVFPLGDTLHHTAFGQRWKGAYAGRAIKRWLFDGIKPRHLKPLSATRSGKNVIVRFSVPTGPLVIDITSVPAMTYRGFSLVDSGGSPLTISSVSLLSHDQVLIKAAVTVPSGAKVQAGFAAIDSGRGGTNLRDSAGDEMVFDPGGANNRLDNWCPIFEMAVS